MYDDACSDAQLETAYEMGKDDYMNNPDRINPYLSKELRMAWTNGYMYMKAIDQRGNKHEPGNLMLPDMFSGEELEKMLSEAIEETLAEEVPDNVNSPAHYTQGDIECIDAIRAALSEEEFRGFCKGAAMKYIWRERYKGGEESLLKAQWFLEQLSS